MASSTADPVEWVTMKAAQNPPTDQDRTLVVMQQCDRARGEMDAIRFLLNLSMLKSFDPEARQKYLRAARYDIRVLEARVKQIREWIDALT